MLWNDVSYATWFAWGSFALFLVAVTANEPIRDKLGELNRHRSVIRRLIARLERDWDQLASKSLTRRLAAVELPGHRRDVAGDLDLLGRASLYHLVSMAATAPGIRTLAQWLAGPAEATIARSRGAAVESLAPLREERLRFYTLARQIGESAGDPDHFVQWAAGKPWLAERRWLVLWSKLSAILAIVFVLALIAAGIGIAPRGLIRFSLIATGMLIAVNVILTAVMLGPAHAIFSIAMSNRRAVDDYEEIFSAANWLPANWLPSGAEPEGGASSAAAPEVAGPASSFLDSIQDRLIRSEHSAVEGMRQLRKVARAGGLRQSAGTFLLYLPLQCLALWDVLVLDRLEQWQATYADHVGQWFDALGELESLMSIAALRDEYPDWCRPSFAEGTQDATLGAVAIGHPLLRDGDRVCNDVSVGPPGTVLLVTGSNMSGKSTLLRSIGLNVSLAAVGAPVCAREFSLPSVELASSIRVSDDVSQGVSFYMAELKRLKSVVDHAREMSGLGDRVCLFLLDEILQGTNSRERQIAVVQVLKHLIDSGAIGAISTHDLELADEPELAEIAHVVHFRETIHPDASGNEQMTFDYKMREGVSPTTNALRLLKMVGLGEREDQQGK
jgi:predicted ATPase